MVIYMHILDIYFFLSGWWRCVLIPEHKVEYNCKSRESIIQFLIWLSPRQNEFKIIFLSVSVQDLYRFLDCCKTHRCFYLLPMFCYKSFSSIFQKLYFHWPNSASVIRFCCPADIFFQACVVFSFVILKTKLNSFHHTCIIYQ